VISSARQIVVTQQHADVVQQWLPLGMS